ncbi:hypothetical protein [Evansella clarkii]|uniref:hypothetical protein n=1 Tax=Evansella clarkii TaxID=79879 RepID=UPI000996E803|nr:hypothetical protein [Evansella clarkii]
MSLSIQTYLEDFPFLDDAGESKYISLNDDYVHEVFALMYKMNGGHLYGGITFTLNGQNLFKKIVDTDDLFATWSSLLSYYEKEGFQPEQPHDLFFGQINFIAKNGTDIKNPQVQFIHHYERTTTEWLPLQDVKDAIRKGFLEYMEIVKEDVINNRIYEDGDTFDMHPSLPDLLESFKEFKSS